MGWIDSLLDKGVESGVRNHARGTCQAMVFAAQQIARRNEGESDPACDTYAKIAAKALELRPGWRRIPGGESFVHEDSGMTLSIHKAWSVARVVREVVGIEVAEMVANLPSPKPPLLVAEAFAECDRVFGAKTGG